MKWITREKVKVDRVACPWLIKKFIDPPAEFLFVPGAEVAERANELDATPFDIEGCELGHHGEDVSFNSILKKYNLAEAGSCGCASFRSISRCSVRRRSSSGSTMR